MWAEVTCKVTGKLDATCAAADKLVGIAKAAGGSMVCLEKRSDELLARYEAGSASLPLVPPDEFPEPRPIEGGPTLVVPAGALPAAVARVAPCVLKEQAKFCLGGARLRVGPEGATLCATDSHRLSKVALPGVAEGRWPDAIIPGPALELFGELAGAVTLRLGEGLIRAESAGLTVTARLLEGPYPDVEALIPTAATPVFSCATEVFKAAVKRTLLVVGANAAPIVGVRLTPGSPGLVWATQGATTAEAHSVRGSTAVRGRLQRSLPLGSLPVRLDRAADVAPGDAGRPSPGRRCARRRARPYAVPDPALPRSRGAFRCLMSSD